MKFINKDTINKMYSPRLKTDSFFELACDFRPSDLGYTLAHIEDLPYDMEMLYDKHKIEKYGALAIRVSHIL